MQQTQIDLDLLSGPHAFWDGLIQMRERTIGHRSGTDAVLLSACLPPDAKGLVADLGCGSGVVGLGAVARHADLQAILVDNDPFMAALCQLNARENDLAGGCGFAKAIFWRRKLCLLRAGSWKKAPIMS